MNQPEKEALLTRMVDEKVKDLFTEFELYYDEAAIMNAVSNVLRRRSSLPEYRNSANFSVIPLPH